YCWPCRIMTVKHYDLIIVGGGPAGYISAERAGSLGKSVLLVEECEIGGVCLNEGCIPTKTLLHGAKLYHEANESERFGVTVTGVRYDIARAMAHKTKTIQTLQKGILAQMKRHHVEVRTATARLLGPGRVEVDGEEVRSDYVLLATGGTSTKPPIPGLEESSRVLTSREILDITTLPERLTVIGGGYIGMEFATYFAKVGVRVTVVEMTEEIIPMLDPATAQALRKQLPAIDYRLGHRVEAIEECTDGGVVRVAPVAGGEPQAIEADLVLLATGRVPYTDGAGFREAGLDVERGGVRVDDYMQTNVPGVYAAGDVTGRMLLAHAAYRMGEVAVSHMFRPAAAGAAGRTAWPNRMRYHAVPWVVFTSPEVAGCGMDAREAALAGLDATSVQLPLRVSGRYLAEHPTERGSVTIVAERATGRLVGVRMVGSGVGEIIHSAAVMIEQELRIRDIREIVFPHPTVGEALRDAAWAIDL
ncbi:MAG: dihydrolipoyl dehydrogenase, partial [Spirochaetales bacterium]|nr:dihydrolipoyl dehydrogenase [Spirochaetales bacterium]